MPTTANTKPLSLLVKDKVATVFLTAIVALLTRACIFFVPLGADNHVISRGIASLADALMELHGTVTKMEDWIEGIVKNQNDAQQHPVQITQRAASSATSLCSSTRSAQLGQSQRLGPTPASSMAPIRVFTPSSALLQASPQPTPLPRRDNSDNLLSILSAPALLSHRQAVPTHSTPRAFDAFSSPRAAHVAAPLAYRGNGYPINTPHSTPPTFWQPVSKDHFVKLVPPEHERDVSTNSASAARKSGSSLPSGNLSSSWVRRRA